MYISALNAFKALVSTTFLSLPYSLQFKWFRFLVIAVKNARSNLCPLAARRLCLLNCKNSLISPKRGKNLSSKPCTLVSHGVSAYSSRSPYSADMSSNSTLCILCSFALELVLFMIFTTGVMKYPKPITFAHIACRWMMQW